VVGEAGAHQQALGELPLPVRADGSDRARVERHRPTALRRLRRADTDLVVDRDHCLHDRQPGRDEVDVGPAQAEALPAPHPRGGQQDERGVEPVILYVVEERAQLAGRPRGHRRLRRRRRPRRVGRVGGVAGQPAPPDRVTEARCRIVWM
jgi:hypothetical protein